MPWLDALRDPSDPAARTLVLCRTSAAANAVRRHVAAHGGQVGIEIVTPAGLARSLEPPRLWREEEAERPAPLIPDGHPWASVSGRPGLAEILSGHVSDIRLEGLAGEDVPLEIRPLLAGGWGLDAGTAALAALAERAAGGPGAIGFRRVFAVGFGEPPAGLPQPPGTRRLFERILGGLGAVALAAPARRDPAAIPTVLAADVGAEAAWVVDQAVRFRVDGGALEDVLVLVSGAADADRIAAALGRSGLPAAVDRSQRLTRHALAVLVRSVLPWFTDAAPDVVEIEGEALRKLFLNPLVGSGDYGDDEKASLGAQVAAIRATVAAEAEERGEAASGGPDDDLYLSRRAVTPALLACHRRRASLADWIASLERVAASAGERVRTRCAALLLRQRLVWLRTLRGPTMGDVSAFLKRLSLRTFGDRVAMTIQRALADARSRPATEAVLDEALDGAASSRELHRGVTLLDYAHYDGRPSALCLLTGLHSKGVGQAPAPDPFFSVETAARWGRIGGAAHVRFLLEQATAAAARAGSARACVVQRAADGRAVVPVSHRLLALVDEEPPPALRNYGLELPTPEAGDHAALGVVAAPIPPEGPRAGGDAVTDHAAAMATIEWIRNGAALRRSAAPADAPTTLRDFVERDWDAIPAALRPWLGDASATPDAALPPDATLSVTGGFEPLSHCLFQAYLKTRLRLRAPETLEEELTAREVGSAVHKALELVGVDPRWRPDPADRAAAVAWLTEELTRRAREQLEQQLERLPGVTPALHVARAGLAARWARHLALYVESRVEDRGSLDEGARKEAWTRAKGSAEYGLLVALAHSGLEKATYQDQACKWIPKAVVALGASGDPSGDETLGHCTGASRPIVREWTAGPEVQALLRPLAREYEQALARLSADAGRIVGGQPEWSFGSPDGSPAVSLPLGDGPPVPVRGAVDRVRVTESPGGDRTTELLDYKTGTSFAQALDDEIAAGTRPQLPVYALALAAARESGAVPAAVREPTPIRLAYDFVRDLTKKGRFAWEPGEGWPSLDEAARLLGWLLARARAGQYPSLPHDLTCPVLNRYGHDWCPFPAACRFGRHPGADDPVDETESKEAAE
jgi:RecB family exonuclease